MRSCTFLHNKLCTVAGAVKAALLAGAVMLMLGGRFHGLNPRVKVDIVVFLDSA